MVHADFIPLFSLLASSSRSLDSKIPAMGFSASAYYTSRNDLCLEHTDHGYHSALRCSDCCHSCPPRSMGLVCGTCAACLAPLTSTAVEPCDAAAQQWSHQASAFSQALCCQTESLCPSVFMYLTCRSGF